MYLVGFPPLYILRRLIVARSRMLFPPDPLIRSNKIKDQNLN